MRPALRRAAALARPAAQLSHAVARRSRLTVIGWHRIDKAGTGVSTDADVFLRQLDALDAWGAAVLPLHEAARLLAADRLPDHAVALTFDDGYASVLETAWPELRSRGLPATLFVVSGYLDGTRRFAWDAADATAEHTRLADTDAVLAAAADGLDIGSHTVTHRWLPHLAAGELRDELSDSRIAIEAVLGRAVSSVAYPMGGWNRAVREATGTAGYSLAITVDRGRNAPDQDPLALRRAFAPDSVEDFTLLLDGAYTWLRPLDTWRTRKGPRW